MQNMHNRKLISGPFEMYFGHTVSGSLRSKILVNDSLRLEWSCLIKTSIKDKIIMQICSDT